MADPITSVNQGIMNYFKSMNFLNIIGWLVFAGILIGIAIWGSIYYKNKKVFNKKITAFEIIGITFQPVIRDFAKTIKIGTGGFEILYLKKLKTWKIGFGGRVGKNDYYFFIMPDGYWYNAMLGSNMYTIDKQDGLIPIVTTNPTMRTQYTALEKQIDSLHQSKGKFWEKYGAWILSIGFVLIAGIMLWLNYKEMVKVSSNFVEAMKYLKDGFGQQTTTGGIIPVK